MRARFTWTTVLIFSTTLACSLSEAEYVTEGPGITVRRGEGPDRGKTFIAIDTNDSLVRLLADDPELRAALAAALRADGAFRDATRGDTGPPGAPVEVRSVEPPAPRDCAGRGATTITLGAAGAPDSLLTLCDGARGPAGRDADEARATALEAAVQELRDGAYCPRLVTREGDYRAYVREQNSPEGTVRCRFHAGPAGVDEMVKVGGFWVDRYEASVEIGSGSAGTGPAHDTFARAISRTNAAPETEVSWFQAVALCANAGKRLCTNGEWQAAVSGTHDPGASPGAGQAPGSGPCNTDSTGVRNTGRAGSTPRGVNDCVSKFGAEDMIGNVWEWVDLWGQAGRPQDSGQGQARAPWPQDYGGDSTFNVDGESSHAGVWASGAPAAAARGGSSAQGPGAGAFALTLNSTPAQAGGRGFRCCAGSN